MSRALDNYDLVRATLEARANESIIDAAHRAIKERARGLRQIAAEVFCPPGWDPVEEAANKIRAASATPALTGEAADKIRTAAQDATAEERS